MSQSSSGDHRKIASPIHTILVVAALGGWAFAHKISVDHVHAGAHPNRVRAYLLIVLLEWLLFALVMAGVWRSRTSLRIVLGDRWHSVGQILRDIGIAIRFWVVAGGCFGYSAGFCVSISLEVAERSSLANGQDIRESRKLAGLCR